MSTDLRVLDQEDLPELLTLLRRDPLVNLFVASRITSFGLSPERLGSSVFGYLRGGQLRAACHVGANVVPINADPDALTVFADAIGPRRAVASIMGEAAAVAELHRGLAQRWSGWDRPREIRAHQPLMVIETNPAVQPDARVLRLGPEHFEPYLAAAIAMYTEEVGISPLDASGSYQRYVRMLMSMGHAMGALHRGRVWFKSDIGSTWGEFCQVQGVWLDPGLRGRRMSVAAMAQVVKLCRERYPVVSLYVNDFNVRARRLYETVGFRTVGELATVLY